MSVSYTHLDVYKRQANYKAVRKAFDNEQTFAEALAKYGYQVKDTSLVYNSCLLYTS